MTRKISLLMIALSLVIAVGFELGATNAYAWKRVDCNKVMAELHTGKKVKVVAKDLGISTSSVYRCRRKAKAAEKEKPSAKTTSKKSSDTKTSTMKKS